MAFICLGILDSTSALYLEVILNSKITNEKHKNAQILPLSRLEKMCVHSFRAATGRQGVALLDLGWECARGVTILGTSVSRNIDLGVTNTFQQFTSTESVNKEDQLCIFVD